MSYPVAEIFNSIQGEGQWSGTPMTFIRLAGCNVGQYPRDLKEIIQLRGAGETPFERKDPLDPEGGAISCRHSICESFDGARFMCDTDYHSVMKLELADLAKLSPIYLLPHVCLTGGEPFMHDLDPLIAALEEDYASRVHIETSGTLPISDDIARSDTWITCSPKKGFLPENVGKIDEWKFIFRDHESLVKIRAFIDDILGCSEEIIWLTPINNLHSIDLKEAQRCVEWIMVEEPTWRLNLQIHKLLEMR